MAEETQQVEEQVQQEQQPENVDAVISDSLRASIFDEPKQVEAQAEPAQEAATQEQVQPEAKEEDQVFDESDWLKTNFGVESKEAAVNEWKELRELKSKKAEDIKFADEQSKQLYDLISSGKKKEARQFLETQERLENLTAAEVTKETAEDIIKLGMQLKYKDLKQHEIDYKFNKEFGIPKEPKRSDLETDDEYDARKQDWQERVTDVEMNRVIEAKLSKPELEKLKSELVLPKIERENQTQQPQVDQKDLENFKKECETFFQTAQPIAEKFGGFSVQVKDKDVDYTVSYAPAQDEKAFIVNKLKQFADNGLNANILMADRWLTKEGETNIEQIQKDLYRLYYAEKAEQKLVTDAVGKRLDLYIKEKKNIRVNNESGGSTLILQDAKSENDALRDWMLNMK